MGKYRTKLEIVTDILRTAAYGTRKTHIMYKCNLSYKLLKHYLSRMLKVNLISLAEEDIYYITTEQGRLFLEEYEKYAGHLAKAKLKARELKEERRLLEKMITMNI
jgi:predicted transcriptional regulator